MTETTRNLLQTLNHIARVGFAYVVFIVLLLLLMANWGIPHFSALKPQLILALVYYWTLYRPTMMPPWVILTAGLLIDLMHPTLPLGTHAAGYLLISALLKPRRRTLMGQSFVMVWVVFVLAVAADLIFKWLVTTMLTDSGLDLSILLLNGFVTVLCFPILVFVLVAVHRLLPAGRGMIKA